MTTNKEDEKIKEHYQISEKVLDKNTYKHDWLGYLASVLGPLSLCFEIYHVHKTKSSKALSYYWLVLSLIVSCLWLAHSIINKIKPGVLSSVIYINLMFVMIYLKHKYSKKKYSKKK
jgi:uncharacterized protein with PQ loop repeat